MTLLRPSVQPESSTDITLLGDSIETSKNATKRRKISKHGMSTTQMQMCSNYDDDQNGHTSSSEAALSDIQGGHQAPDVTLAANVLHSLQHGSQSHVNLVATGFSPLMRAQASSFASGTSEKCSTAVSSVAFIEVSNASTEEHQALSGGSGKFIMQSSHSSMIDLHRSNLSQQHLSSQLDVLSDGPAENSPRNNVDLPDRGLDNELESPLTTVADGLFLSDFMQEYQDIM